MYAEMLLEGWAKGKEQVYYRHISSELVGKSFNRVVDFVVIAECIQGGNCILVR